MKPPIQGFSGKTESFSEKCYLCIRFMRAGLPGPHDSARKYGPIIRKVFFRGLDIDCPEGKVMLPGLIGSGTTSTGGK